MATEANLVRFLRGDAHGREARGMAPEANLVRFRRGDAHGWEARGMAPEADLAGIGDCGPSKGDRLHGRKLLNVHLAHVHISWVRGPPQNLPKVEDDPMFRFVRSQFAALP
jgi:hypothetical protein